MIRQVTTAILLVAGLSCCGPAPRELDLGDGTWMVMSAETTYGHWDFEGGSGPTLSTDTGQAVSGCTLFTFEGNTRGGVVEISTTRSGQMRGSCGPAEGGIDDPFHGHFDEVLRSVEHVDRRDGQIILSGDGVRLVLQEAGRTY